MPHRSPPPPSARSRRSTRLAPELEAPAAELRELTVRLSEVGSELHRFVASLETDPARIEEVEERLDLIAELRRRFARQTLDELLDRRDAAVVELEALDGGVDPLAAAAAELATAEERYERSAGRSRRHARRPPRSRSPPRWRRT